MEVNTFHCYHIFKVVSKMNVLSYSRATHFFLCQTAAHYPPMVLFIFNGSTKWSSYWTTSLLILSMISYPLCSNNCILGPYHQRCTDLFRYIDNEVQTTLQYLSWLSRETLLHCDITSCVAKEMCNTVKSPMHWQWWYQSCTGSCNEKGFLGVKDLWNLFCGGTAYCYRKNALN